MTRCFDLIRNCWFRIFWTPKQRGNIFYIRMMHWCCCCWYWPPVFEVSPNYEVVDFQPRKLTTTDLSSIAYCYVHLLNPPHPPLLLSNVPSPQLYSSVLNPHRIIHPPGHHPYLSQNTENPPSPSLPSPITTRSRPFLSSLVLTMTARFPSSLLPRCCKNIF